MLEDTKGVIKAEIRRKTNNTIAKTKSSKDKQYNSQNKKNKRQTMTDTILCSKLQNEQHESH